MTNHTKESEVLENVPAALILLSRGSRTVSDAGGRRLRTRSRKRGE